MNKYNRSSLIVKVVLTRIRNRDQPGNKIKEESTYKESTHRRRQIKGNRRNCGQQIFGYILPLSLTASFLALYATCTYAMACCCKPYHLNSHTHTHTHTHTLTPALMLPSSQPT